jgi:hypothetical protein
VAFSQALKAYRTFEYIDQVVSKEKSILLLKLIQIVMIWVSWSFLEFLLDASSPGSPGSPGIFISYHLDVLDKV